MAGTIQSIRNGILETDLDANHFSIINLNLGVFGFQPLDADLTAIAALTTLPFGRGALGMLDAAAFRSYIGAQAYDADLDTWATKTPYAGALTITTGKTFNVTGTLTLAGTDASTLNIGGGGTLGTAAYTAATAYEPASGTKNVMNYGALADDIADDTGAINAALAAAGTYGRIFIPKGTYYIGGQLNPPIGSETIGAGMDSTILHVKATSNPANATIFCSSPGQRYGLLQDFTIQFDQPDTVGMGWADLIQYKPAIIGCPTLRLTNIQIGAAWDGVDFSYYSGSQAYFDNVRIGAFNNGITIAQTSDNMYASKLHMAGWGMGVENVKIYYGQVTPNPTACGINILGQCDGLYITMGIFSQSGPAIKALVAHPFVQLTGVWFDGQSYIQQGAGVINLVGCNLNGGGPNKVTVSGGQMNISGSSAMFYSAGVSASPMIDVSGGSLNLTGNQFVYDSNGESDDLAIRQTGGITVISGNVFTRGETGSHTFTNPTIVKTGGVATITDNRSSALLGGTSTFLSVSGDTSNDRISGNVSPGWVTFTTDPDYANLTVTSLQASSGISIGTAPVAGRFTAVATTPVLYLQTTATGTKGFGWAVNWTNPDSMTLINQSGALLAYFPNSGGINIGSSSDPGAGNLILQGLSVSQFIQTDANKKLVSKTAGDMRTDLGLVIGTNVQAYDADLTTWAGITPGTGVAIALGVNVGSAGAFLTFNGALGTPSSGTLTNATGLPISTGISGLGTGVATFLATPSSANLLAAVTDETGTGALVFANTPTLVTPNIGAATGTSLVVSGNLTATGGTVTLGSTPLIGGTDTIEQRNSTNPQTFNIYNTYTSGSVFERGFARWASTIFEIGTEHTGANPRNLRLKSANLILFNQGAAEQARFTGAALQMGVPIIFGTDNTFDIGASGATRPRTLYLATSLVFAGGNIVTDTTTGTKIGTATAQKLGFWNATPVVQPTAVTDASGGAIIDIEGRAAINGLLSKLRTIGIIAT